MLLWFLSWPIALAYGLVFLNLHRSEWAFPLLVMLDVAASIGLIFILRTFLDYRWTAIPLLYAYYLILAHVPVFLFWVINPDILQSEFELRQIQWITGPGGAPAAVLVLVAFTAFTAGVILTGRKSREQGQKLYEEHRPLFVAGMLLAVLGIILFFRATLVGGGLSTLLSAYKVVREDIYAQAAYEWAILFTALGTGFALVGVPRKHWFIALLPFGLLAPFFLFAGDRGSVLYPLPAYLAVLSRRQIKLPRSILLMSGLLIVFLLIPLVREVRQVGVREASSQELQLGLLDPLIEMGFTVRTVAVTYEQVQNGFVEIANGGSYWLPLERQLMRFNPYGERSDANTDPRNPQRFTIAMGYSPVAEAYFNFGFIGPLIVFPLLGLLFGRLEQVRSNSPYVLGATMVILFVMIDNVRNAFISVPGRIGFGLVLLGALFLFDRLLLVTPRSSRAHSRVRESG